jgi:tricorn protease
VTTAGGVISAAKDRILDAGTLRVPFRGWFLPGTGEDMEMNGATPDILVESGPADTIGNTRPQLRTAVATLLKDVEHATEEPFVPKYRNR